MGFLLFLIVCALTVLAWLAAIGSAIPYGGGGMGFFLIAVAMTILVIGWVGVWIIGGIWGLSLSLLFLSSPKYHLSLLRKIGEKY